MLVDINKFIRKIMEGTSPKSAVTELMAEEGITEIGAAVIAPIAGLAARAIPALSGAVGRGTIGAAGATAGRLAGAAAQGVSSLLTPKKRPDTTTPTSSDTPASSSTPPPSSFNDEFEAARAFLAELDRRATRMHEVDARKLPGNKKTVAGRLAEFKKQVKNTDQQPDDRNTKPDPRDRLTGPRYSVDNLAARKDRDSDVDQDAAPPETTAQSKGDPEDNARTHIANKSAGGKVLQAGKKPVTEHVNRVKGVKLNG